MEDIGLQNTVHPIKGENVDIDVRIEVVSRADRVKGAEGVVLDDVVKEVVVIADFHIIEVVKAINIHYFHPKEANDTKEARTKGDGR